MQGNDGSNGDPPPTTPANTPGSWQQSSSGTWTWNPTANPNPALVSQWGYGAITNVQEAPDGTANYGSWSPQHGGGWNWTWGTNPDPDLLHSYTASQLTNPDQSPDGNNTTTQNTPPPNDVNTPNLNDTWNGSPPIVTGNPTGTQSSTTVSTPPPVSAFTVAPGDIRNAESVVDNATDGLISDYNALQSQVNAAVSGNVYSVYSGDLNVEQDRLLLNIGDVLDLTGQYLAALNNAAQYYARADLDSFLPQS